MYKVTDNSCKMLWHSYDLTAQRLNLRRRYIRSLKLSKRSQSFVMQDATIRDMEIFALATDREALLWNIG